MDKEKVKAKPKKAIETEKNKTSKTDPVQTRQTSQAPKSKNIEKILSMFALFVSLACIVIILRQNYQQNTALDKLKQQIGSQINSLQESDTKTTENRELQFIQLKDTLKSNKERSDTLVAKLQTLAEQKNISDDSWQLQRANYLLSMAQLSAHFEKNPAATLSLLEATDKIIKQLNNPQFIALRQTLSNEITALKAINTIDKEGSLASFNSLTSVLDQLAFSKENPSMPVVENQNKTGDKKGWRAVVDNSLSKLSKIVVIRRNNKSYVPLIAPTNQRLIIEQLSLCFQQAQWALIYRDNTSYQFSIEQAINILNRQFDPTDKSTQAMLEKLDSLKKLNVNPTMPDITRSKQQLKQLIQHSMRQSS